jgi:hypothetical protein
MAALALSLAGAGQARAGFVVADSINQNASPAAGYTWGATEVGWYYTPASSYDLVGVQTRFGSADSRTVTVEVYDAYPGDGGVLLRSADFTPAADAFAGGVFAPLGLVAGHTYFVGFRNVGDLAVNVTLDDGATNLPGGLRFSFANDGSYVLGPETGFTAQPILQFLKSSSTPEPASLTLLALGAIAQMGFAWRRRRGQLAQGD